METHVIRGSLPSGTEEALRRGAMMGDCAAVNIQTVLLFYSKPEKLTDLARIDGMGERRGRVKVVERRLRAEAVNIPRC